LAPFWRVEKYKQSKSDVRGGSYEEVLSMQLGHRQVGPSHVSVVQLDIQLLHRNCIGIVDEWRCPFF
jgi:hypothetical protein